MTPVVSEQKATEKIAEQPGVTPAVSEQKDFDQIAEQPGVTPVVSEQKDFDKIAEQPGGVAPLPSEQKATELIAEPMEVAPEQSSTAPDEQMVAAGEDAEGVESKPKQTTGAVRFAVENPQLLHRFDFKETAFTIFWASLVVVAQSGRRELWR